MFSEDMIKRLINPSLDQEFKIDFWRRLVCFLSRNKIISLRDNQLFIQFFENDDIQGFFGEQFYSTEEKNAFIRTVFLSIKEFNNDWIQWEERQSADLSEVDQMLRKGYISKEIYDKTKAFYSEEGVLSKDIKDRLKEKHFDKTKLLLLFHMFNDQYMNLYWAMRKEAVYCRYTKNQDMQRGYYGPSSVFDLLISNTRRYPFYKKAPHVLNNKTEYGYKENGNLCLVSRFDSNSTPENEECIFYVGKMIIGFLWNYKKLTSITMQKYGSDGRIQTMEQLNIRYESLQIKTRESGLLFSHEEEDYKYTENGGIQQCIHYDVDIPSALRGQLTNPYRAIGIVFDQKDNDTFIIVQRNTFLNREKQIKPIRLEDEKACTCDQNDQRWFMPDYFFETNHKSRNLSS